MGWALQLTSVPQFFATFSLPYFSSANTKHIFIQKCSQPTSGTSLPQRQIWKTCVPKLWSVLSNDSKSGPKTGIFPCQAHFHCWALLPYFIPRDTYFLTQRCFSNFDDTSSVLLSYRAVKHLLCAPLNWLQRYPYGCKLINCILAHHELINSECKPFYE